MHCSNYVCESRRVRLGGGEREGGIGGLTVGKYIAILIKYWFSPYFIGVLCPIISNSNRIHCLLIRNYCNFGMLHEKKIPTELQYTDYIRFPKLKLNSFHFHIHWTFEFTHWNVISENQFPIWSIFSLHHCSSPFFFVYLQQKINICSNDKHRTRILIDNRLIQ